MDYHIFHATGEHMFTETENQPVEYVGTVQANSLEEAYLESQNTDECWNLHQDIRSTSVGDVIQDDEHCYMVCGIGFRLLDKPEDDNVPELCYE
jgi:hypothetical protein